MNMNAKNQKFRTPLHNTETRSVKCMHPIRDGASVNCVLLTSRRQKDYTPLHFAVENGSKEDVIWLLSRGANVDAKGEDRVTPLHIAAKKGYIGIAEDLLNHGACTHSLTLKAGYTPLHFASELGTEKAVVLFLNRGADINSRTKDNFTPLHIATQNGHKEFVRMLLGCGAKVDSKTKTGITPLHLGVQKGYREIIETLLKSGADIHSRDKYGRTALHLASQVEHEEVVEILLEYGSDINMTSRNNYTPFDYAMARLRSSRNYDIYDSDDDGPDLSGSSQGKIFRVFRRHIVKLETANLYVNEKNLQSASSSEFFSRDEINLFRGECEKEIASMKSEKINKANISFYDILVKGASSLAICMTDENIVQVLKSGEYKTKFAIYASMIESNFKKGMERKELLEQANKIFHFLFNNCPELPYDCTDKIFSYLSNKDLKILMDTFSTIILDLSDL